MIPVFWWLRGHCQPKCGEIQFDCEVPNRDLNALGHVASPEFHRTWMNAFIRSCTRQVRWMEHVVWAPYSCCIDIFFLLRAFSKLPLPNLSGSLTWPDWAASVSPVQSFYSPWIQHWDKHHVYSSWILVLSRISWHTHEKCFSSIFQTQNSPPPQPHPGDELHSSGGKAAFNNQWLHSASIHWWQSLH